jgi:glucose/arabinose dehydrogenase
VVVDRIDAGHRRRVWTGPPSATLANGGHLALDTRGRLLIGIGDLQQPPRIRDPRFPNGKLLALDPAGPADQRPTILSSGWNNPYAFAVAPDGAVWVADNSPGTRPERIGRGDRPGAPLWTLHGETAPSGLAVIDDRTLAVCGVVSGRLDRYRVRSDGRVVFAGTIARGCAFGVVRLSDGRLAFSTPHGIREVHP